MDVESKIEQLQALAASDPNDELTFYLLGVEQLHAGQYGEAIQSLERAIALAPDHTAAYRMLADALRLSGDAARARAAYERAIEVAERTGDLQVAKEARAFLKKLGEPDGAKDEAHATDLPDGGS